MTFDYINKTIDERFNYTSRRGNPIKIAVLDTGIDKSHADFQQPRSKSFGEKDGGFVARRPVRGEEPQNLRIKNCRNYCTDNEDGDDDFEDLDGHGTAVAGIILRLVPRAEICVARVSLASQDGRSLNTPENMKKYRTPNPTVVARVSISASLIYIRVGKVD